MHALALSLDQRHHVLGLAHEAQQLEIAFVDLAAREHRLPQPAHQSGPLAVAEQDHREVADRRRLDQRQRLEHLVEGAVAAGRDHERTRVAHEHDLASEEVAEAKADVEVRVEVLLVRELDVEPDRDRTHVARAAVRGFHQPRPAAGYHGESRAAYARPDLSYKRVVGVILGRARRAEHRDRRPEPRERVEAARELRRDVMHAFGVGRTHRLGLVAEPGEELLVEGQRASARGARLAAHRVWSRSASASMRSSRV